MISSTFELTVTHQKLADLKRHYAQLLAKSDEHNRSHADELTLQSYLQLIEKLTGEIHRFENGLPEPVRARDAIQSEEQLRAAQGELDEVIACCREFEQQPKSPPRDAALLSLLRRRSRLMEELAWYKIRSGEPALSNR